jgi:hypothetical protein
MIPTALAALREHSHRLLIAVRSEEDDTLEGLLATREELLQRFGAAVSSGEALDPVEAQVIEALDQTILAAMRERRDATRAELAALLQGRNAGAAYHGPNAAPARYLDRAG